MKDDMTDNVNQLYVRDINRWIICQLIMWIAYILRELH
jgi:hypothetical protein